MDIGAAFIAHAQAAKLMQPGERALHHPAVHAQATAVFGVAPRQEGFDAPLAQRLAMRLGIIGPIPLHGLGPASRMADFTPDGRNGLDQGQQLQDIGGIGRRQYCLPPTESRARR